MPIDFNKYFYIGCIPVYAMPTHPKDQTPCVIRKCHECNLDMWVSEKKRLLESKDKKAFKVVCLTCLAKAAFEAGIEPVLKSL